MELRLQARYTLVIVMLILTIIFTLTAILLHQFQSSMKTLTIESASSTTRDLLKQTERHGETMVRYFAENLANAMYQFDMETIYQLLQAGFSQVNFKKIYVYDTSGKIIHDGTVNIESFGESIGKPEVIEAVQHKDKMIKWKTHNALNIAYPVWIGETPLGGVAITFSLSPIKKDILNMENRLTIIGREGLTKNLWTAFFSTLGLILFGIIFSIFISRGLIKPIHRLSQFAGQIGHGNYNVDINIDRKDEIGDLANAFQEMRNNLQRSTEEIRHLAYHDSLTQLPNRLMFREYLEHTLRYSQRRNQSLAVLFIDLDDFKRVNDSLGHDAGDMLLKEVAQRIQLSIRFEDYAATAKEDSESPNMARLGGDEFTILLTPIKAPFDAAIVARRIISILAQPFMLKEREVVIGASIGITLYPQDGKTADVLLKNADLAMYHAKENGKNQYQYFKDSLNTAVLQKVTLENDLRRALEREEFRLWYQPLLDLVTGEVVGFEALIRWKHPKRGMVSPADFIPVAEETGLIVPIGEWAIHTACRQVKQWHKLERSKPYAAINVSSIQFNRQEVHNVFKSALSLHQIDPQFLHIEITETALMQSEGRVKETLEKLKALGIRIWMDDFGTGYSSLGYLRRFPVDGVKIDRSFIHGTDTNKNDRELASAIIAMAHNLNLGVVAEGVENETHLRFLQDKHCEVGQGYFFSKPIPGYEIPKILTTENKLIHFLPDQRLIKKEWSSF